jgi:uncharacterized protein YbjT (DUF2867 family)
VGVLDQLTPGRVLLTGATGYVGGRLLPALERSGRPLRCAVRTPDRLAARTGPKTDVVAADVFDQASLERAMAGVEVAYYLVHSMGSEGRFAERDRAAAEAFGAAARAQDVRRLVYLGGLGHGAALSPHLRSRQEVGRILAAGGVETIEFRASIVIGSGSLSFEMVRALVERLPVMVTPRWVRTPTQPIAIEDVIAYLVAALELPAGGSRVYEIGGADVVSYGELMREYARQRGLRRTMIEVPVLSPQISSLWLSLITPLYARVGRNLVDGVRNETLVTDDAARRDFDIAPRGVAEAIERALRFEDAAFAATRWSDAGQPRPGDAGSEFGARMIDTRVAHVPCPPAEAFAPIRRIGGRSGWYAADVLWELRGLIDQLFGGVGLRRGRRDPETVARGDTLDFWRVEAFEPDRLLRLAAEMRLPGRAWLQFEVTPDGRGGSRIRQTAEFDPMGASGRAYWYGLYPFHALIFRRMIRAIARQAMSPPPRTPHPVH